MFGTCLSQPHAGRLQLHDDRTKRTQPWTNKHTIKRTTKRKHTMTPCIVLSLERNSSPNIPLSPASREPPSLHFKRENRTLRGCLGNLFSILILFRVSHNLPAQHLTKIVSGIIISYLFFSLIHCSIISKGTEFSMANKVGIALVFLMLEANIIPI